MTQTLVFLGRGIQDNSLFQQPLDSMPWHSAAFACPTAWRFWLTDRGSLTRRLMAACAPFRVQRIRQRLARPFADEYAPIRLRSGEWALVREAWLMCADTPLVFAHSVIPRAGLRGPWRRLAGLGDRPLGAALFADPRIKRHPLHWRALDRRHPLYRRIRKMQAGLPARLWARRSLFSLQGQPILVTEVFLPEVLRL